MGAYIEPEGNKGHNSPFKCTSYDTFQLHLMAFYWIYSSKSLIKVQPTDGKLQEYVYMVMGEDDNDHPEKVWPQRYPKADVTVTHPSLKLVFCCGEIATWKLELQIQRGCRQSVPYICTAPPQPHMEGLTQNTQRCL